MHERTHGWDCYCLPVLSLDSSESGLHEFFFKSQWLQSLVLKITNIASWPHFQPESKWKCYSRLCQCLKIFSWLLSVWPVQKSFEMAGCAGLCHTGCQLWKAVTRGHCTRKNFKHPIPSCASHLAPELCFPQSWPPVYRAVSQICRLTSLPLLYGGSNWV